MSFTVAIVGRPNVGKSTLFNRLVGKKLALVDDTPGLPATAGPGHARRPDFTSSTRPAWKRPTPRAWQGRMRAQTEAPSTRPTCPFVVDAKFGLTPVDRTFAEMLRRRGKPVVLVANKSEARGSDSGFYDAYTLGLGEPTRSRPNTARACSTCVTRSSPRSARTVPFRRGRGRRRLDRRRYSADRRGHRRGRCEPAYDDTKPLRVAIVGRPNAGKSTLINRFLGEDRLLTGPEAGITRDSISVEWDWRGRTIKMFDTAGMRRKARVQEKLEKLSVADALRAIRFAETVVIVFDATIPFEKQDLQFVDLVLREGRAPCSPSTSGT